MAPTGVNPFEVAKNSSVWELNFFDFSALSPSKLKAMEIVLLQVVATVVGYNLVTST